MNGKDKISVIIPCYNVQKYIMRCFDSIYSQTYGFENLEVILIDDLSTDNTWSILESLQRKYPENVISLKIQKKGKCGGARNLGMDICTGKYITFVDADDYVHPDMLRVLYDRMTEDDYDVAQCGVSCFKADKPNVLEVNDLEIQRLDLDNVDNRKNLIIGLTGFTNVTAWAKLYSTKFIIEHNLRFIEDVYYEDTHFSMLCVLLAKKYCKVQSTLYYYFENTEGIIRSEISNAKIRDAKIIMDHIRQAIQSRKAELGNVIEQCYCEIQTFLLWHQYIEPYSRIETFMNRELDICKEEFLKSEPDIFNNPYVKFFSDDVVLKRMSRLRVTAKKMNNVCFLDNAIHICLGIHDKDGNYSVWAGTTMQSIVENTKAPIVFHEEVIWLYTFFTDVRTSPVTFTLKELEATMAEEDYTFSREGKTCRYQFKESGRFYTCYMVDDTSDLVHRVEIVSNGCLIRKDFYTYCRTFSEYYAPLDGKAHLYGRTFFNEDGSVCYEEVIEDDSTFYRIGAQVLYTKADLVGYMVKRLNLTADDVVIIDRTTGIGQAILENCGPARVGIVVHADHFSEGGTDDDYILWNNYYEYSFSQTEHIDFYITATDAQNELMRQQFKKYCGKEPLVVTIPVGSLDELKYPDEPRKRHSLITASRLATEKHCDWLVEAVVKAKESVPDISLDIYGKGGDEAKLKGLIGRLGCADYVHLMGQQKLDDVYKHYDAYVAASQSEGFGLTLMEAIGSGLPIVGFDVRYGNQTFIDDGQNGYKIPITDEMDQKEKIKLLSERIVRMFTEDDMDAFSGHSYEKAKEYLTKEVVHRWIELLK